MYIYTYIGKQNKVLKVHQIVNGGHVSDKILGDFSIFTHDFYYVPNFHNEH